MKKIGKKIICIALAVLMMVSFQESILASPAVKEWSILKMPGRTNVETIVTIPYNRGEMAYELKSLTGTCTYVVAKVEADPEDKFYYYIDNNDYAYYFTKPAKVDIAFHITTLGKLVEPNFVFVMSINHNSTHLIDETLTATGTMSYE